MKALVLQKDKKLNIEEVPTPVPQAGEVLVSIKASALNHRELWIAKGLYPGMTLPCILGADGAGVITEVGSEKDQTLKGQEVIIYPGYDWGDDEDAPLKKFRVLGMPDPGTMSEFIVVPTSHVVPKPDYLSWQEAAAIPVAYLTAWRSLTRHGKMTSSSKVLITGIGGGVAQAGLAFAKACGAETYVTSSQSDKINDAISKGAKGGVNYKDEDWPAQLKEISGGIDIVLDSSPLENLDDYLSFLNIGGRIVAYGSTGNRKTTLNISKFFLRHIRFIGTAMGSPKEFKDMISYMEEHHIIPQIDSTFSFDQSQEAMDYLAKGNHIGKVVLSMNA